MKIEIDPDDIELAVAPEHGLHGWRYRGALFLFNEETRLLVDNSVRRRVKRWSDERRRKRSYLGRRDTDFRLIETRKRIALHLQCHVDQMSAHERLAFMVRVEQFAEQNVEQNPAS